MLRFATALSLIAAVAVMAGCLGSNLNAGKNATLIPPRGGVPPAITPPPAVTPVTRYPFSVQRADGRFVTVRAKPARTVSLSPAVTEMIYAVAAQSALVGVDPASDYPAQTASLTHVESAPSAVAALKPDLVLVS